MKYKTGDKFIIEIESRINSQGLYKVKGFRTLVLDDNELDGLEQAHEQSGHDGCKGCEHEEQPTTISPCDECSRNMLDFWTPKTEEIQVGDEVEHNEGKIKGIVICKEYDEDKERVWLRVLTDQKAKYHFWSETLCHRTGKTYPELIKALEQLPKE